MKNFGKRIRRHFQKRRHDSRKRQQARRSFFHAERLEDRHLLSADMTPFHNTYMPEDVNADHRIAPNDALAVINALNAGRAGALLASGDAFGAGLGTASGEAPEFIDVNGDNQLSPIDALIVINRLNAEGEADRVRIDIEITDTSVDRNPITTVNTG